MGLITFESKEAMADALSHEVEQLHFLFYEFRPWFMSKWSHSKKVWIECLGLQPFA